MPPKDDKTTGFDWRGVLHQVTTAVLTAGVLGGWWFFNNTNTELALLRHDVDSLGAKIDGLGAIIEATYPRRGVSPPP
jgi:hypothetical protein